MDRDSAPWWEAVRRHELLLQRCTGCGTPRFPPRGICNVCRGRAAEWTPASGRGRVVSWIVNHQPFVRGRALPYTVLLVRLEEGDDILMYGDLEGDGTVEPGAPVEVVYIDSDDVTLVNWRLSG
jgi:hypothetical protein